MLYTVNGLPFNLHSVATHAPKSCCIWYGWHLTTGRGAPSIPASLHGSCLLCCHAVPSSAMEELHLKQKRNPCIRETGQELLLQNDIPPQVYTLHEPVESLYSGKML